MRFKRHKDSDSYFVVSQNYIELRDSDNEYITNICCKKCLVSLKKAIAKFEKQKAKGDLG